MIQKLEESMLLNVHAIQRDLQTQWSLNKTPVKFLTNKKYPANRQSNSDHKVQNRNHYTPKYTTES